MKIKDAGVFYGAHPTAEQEMCINCEVTKMDDERLNFYEKVEGKPF